MQKGTTLCILSWEALNPIRVAPLWIQSLSGLPFPSWVL